MAKQLNRIAHAFLESGLTINNPLIDDAGAVVAGKSEAPEAVLREVRVWGERSGQRFANDQALLDGYVAEARRLALELTSRMGAGAEAMRGYEHDDAEPASGGGPPPAPDAPAVPPTGGGARETSGPDDQTATGPLKGGVPQPTPPANRPNGQPPAHELAHNRFLEQLRGGLTAPFDAPPSSAKPLGAGEVGRFNQPDRAYTAFREAVARSNGREVGLYYDPNTGEYAVMVGRAGAVGPPRTGGPWDCPIHTHPNPEQVLTYRMPAPNDVFQYWKSAMRNNRAESGFIEYELPDGRRGMSRIEVGVDGHLTFEWPDATGALRTESLGFGEYQERWDARTRYVEPGSDLYQQFLQDIEDYRRDHPPDSGDFTATGPAPPDRTEPAPKPKPKTDAQEHADAVDEGRTGERSQDIDAAAEARRASPTRPPSGPGSGASAGGWPGGARRWSPIPTPPPPFLPPSPTSRAS